MGSAWTVCEVLGRGSEVMACDLLATKSDATSSEVLAAGCGILDSEGLATLLSSTSSSNLCLKAVSSHSKRDCFGRLLGSLWELVAGCCCFWVVRHLLSYGICLGRFEVPANSCHQPGHQLPYSCDCNPVLPLNICPHESTFDIFTCHAGVHFF